MQVPYAVRRKWLHVRLTALTWAATCGHKHVVEKLIATGVNLDTKANSGYDSWALSMQRPSAFQSWRILYGRWTALMWAAMNGRTDVAAALIFAGADIQRSWQRWVRQPGARQAFRMRLRNRAWAGALRRTWRSPKTSRRSTRRPCARLDSDSALPIRRRPGWALHATRPTAGAAGFSTVVDGLSAACCVRWL
jgi:hypothetical protein